MFDIASSRLHPHRMERYKPYVIQCVIHYRQIDGYTGFLHRQQSIKLTHNITEIFLKVTLHTNNSYETDFLQGFLKNKDKKNNPHL
jgi:hypothetical protein